MTFNLKTLAGSGLVLAACLMGVAPAQEMPSDEALRRAMQDVQRRAGAALDRAGSGTQAAPGVPGRVVPNLGSGKPSGIDPGAIAEQYRNLAKTPSDSEAPELLVFVSLSMPEEALRRIGRQARQAGAVVVFRGPKNGLRPGTWVESMNALKPIADTGADVQIHPELFTRYNVTVVPTVVVASSPQAGCQDDACASKAASVSGDVSLDYALSQLTPRKDAIGGIARARLQRMRNG